MASTKINILRKSVAPMVAVAGLTAAGAAVAAGCNYGATAALPTAQAGGEFILAACSPCNPCKAKACNPCNPCAAKNPCKAK